MPKVGEGKAAAVIEDAAHGRRKAQEIREIGSRAPDKLLLGHGESEERLQPHCDLPDARIPICTRREKMSR